MGVVDDGRADAARIHGEQSGVGAAAALNHLLKQVLVLRVGGG
jgi:hypothetical protein